MDSEERLPEARAKQVLARAAQLDAANRMGVSISDLRTAASEAGISPGAFGQGPTPLYRNDFLGERSRTGILAAGERRD